LCNSLLRNTVAVFTVFTMAKKKKVVAKSIVTPVVFIHGLWLHATSWDAWIKLFRRLGYQPVAPGWPKEADSVHEARLLIEDVAGVGLDQITDHYARIIAQYQTKPIVIGHSFGGLVAQKLLGEGRAAAAVVISSAQPKGVWQVPLAQLKAIFPVLKNPLDSDRPVALTAHEFRYSFGNALSNEESTELYTMWAIPSPARPVFAAALANITLHSTAVVNRDNDDRGPLLLIAGGRDHTVPASVVRANHRLYATSPAITDIQEFPDRGHSMTIDHGWREIADAALAWLKKRYEADG